MEKIMSVKISELIKNPVFLGGGLAAVTAVIVLIWAIRFLSNKKLIKSLTQLLEYPDRPDDFIRAQLPNDLLIKKAKVIEKFIEREGRRVVDLLQLDRVWVQALKERQGIREMNRVLRFFPEKGLFTCFLAALSKKSLSAPLLKWLTTPDGKIDLRRLALSGQGETFSGAQAIAMFSIERISEIREMMGDPEWTIRYFTVKILLHDTREQRSVRLLWGALEDPHPRIRQAVIDELVVPDDERDKLHNILYKSIFDDLSFEVRKSAWERLEKELSGEIELSLKKLDDLQIVHLLSLMRAGHKRDEEIALEFLLHKNPEICMAAARYLDSSGEFARLVLETDTGDREMMKRNQKLLEAAHQVHVSGYLSKTVTSANPGALMLSARIMMQMDQVHPLSGVLAENVFKICRNAPEHNELYRQTLEMINKAGNDLSFQALLTELKGEDEKKRALVLEQIPERAAPQLVEHLIGFLKDPDFTPIEGLRDVFKRMPLERMATVMMEILEDTSSGYPREVKVRALRVLGDLNLPYCMQWLLENLSIIERSEARAFSEILSRFPIKELEKRAFKILESDDVRSRAALIAVLPVTRDNKFLKAIQASIKDADPDVRIASVWALVERNDAATINKAVNLLRDPVERVRVEVARAFAFMGNDAMIRRMGEMLVDDNEVFSIKRAIVSGLEKSKSLKSIDILIDRLSHTPRYNEKEQSEEIKEEKGLKQAIVASLSKKQSKDEIVRLIESMKDSDETIRALIADAFALMGEAVEESLVKVLEESISSIQPLVSDVLERTGYVEMKIQRLSHRDPQVRQQAVSFLAILGTKTAFRGIVLAAKDPDEEVRINVIKALEKIETKEGGEILELLKNDPDEKVRKYTHWAVERLKAKAN